MNLSIYLSCDSFTFSLSSLSQIPDTCITTTFMQSSTKLRSCNYQQLRETTSKVLQPLKYLAICMAWKCCMFGDENEYQGHIVDQFEKANCQANSIGYNLYENYRFWARSTIRNNMIQDILCEFIYNEINIVHEEVKVVLMEANKHMVLFHQVYILMVFRYLSLFSKHSLC